MNNKKLLLTIGIGIFIIGIVLCFSVAIVSSFKSKDEKNEQSKENYVGEVDYSVDKVTNPALLCGSIDARNIIPLTNEESQLIMNKYKSSNFITSETDFSYLSSLSDYTITINDYKFLFINDSDYIIINDETFSSAEFYNYTLDIVKKRINKEEKIYLYDLTKCGTMFATYSLKFDNKEIKLIKDSVKNIEYNVENVNTFIDFSYLLIIDGKYIYFDILGGYAMIDETIAVLPNDIFNMLKDKFNYNNECCSCCPDLKPGESCIDMCCPCDS